MAKLPTYEVMIDDDLENVYGISPVYEPANETMFVALSKVAKIELAFDEEKREVTGIVLIPDQLIPRADCNIVFREPQIRTLAQNFLKEGNQNTAFYNHDKAQPLEGWDYVESWIIEDPERDKATVLDLAGRKKGAWAVTAKVTNDELWADVKAGKLNGFSIDSFLRMKEVQLTKYNNKEKAKNMGIFGRKTNLAVELVPIEVEGIGTLYSVDWAVGSIVYTDAEGTMPLVNTKDIVWEDKEFETDAEGKIIETEVEDKPVDELPAVTEEVELDEEPKTLEEALAIIAKLKEGKEAEVEMAEETQLWDFDTEEGGKVYACWLYLGEKVTDDAKAPVASTTFSVAGVKYTTDAEGIITLQEKNVDSPFWRAKGDAPAEDVVDETIEDVPTDEVPAEDIEMADEEAVIADEETSDSLKEKIDKMQEELDAANAKLAEKEKQNVELMKQPAAAPLRAVVSATDLSKMSPLERHRYYKTL